MKLTLNKETLRHLTGTDIWELRGGDGENETYAYSDGCSEGIQCGVTCPPLPSAAPTYCHTDQRCEPYITDICTTSVYPYC